MSDTREEPEITMNRRDVLAKLEEAKALLLEIEDAELPWLVNDTDESFALDDIMDNCPRLLDMAIAKLK
jgi:hypothetical protein